MDVYCERVGMGVFAEPLNAVSNISFLLAALAAWVLAQRTGTRSAEIRVLVAIGASVGIGSFLWHTYPTMLTLLLDVVPILAFFIWYIWLYTRDIIGMRSVFSAASVAAFLLATFFFFQYSDVLHGALIYSPGLLLVLVLGIFQASEQRVARFTLLAAAGVYLAALFFRTIDNEVCPVLPSGTHVLWHLLIGLVTYLAMRSLILSAATGVRPRVR